MTTTDLARQAPERVPLPVSADPRSWTPQQGVLMEFVGLVKRNPQTGQIIQPPNAVAIAEAFLAVCRRTGLDPFAKQIYAMEAGGKWSIVVGVDGFRIIAQRSKGYAGQIGPQWATGRKVSQPLLINGAPVFAPDGSLVMTEQDEWVDAWTPDELGLPHRRGENGEDAGPARPVAARIGILRHGFDQPLWQVVTWREFGVEPRFKGDNWGTRPAHMLGIRAETHGLRRTFPNDLSGIYTPEDFDEVDESQYTEQIEAQIARVQGIDDLAELTRIFHEWNAQGMPDSVRASIMARAGVLQAEAAQREAERGQAEANEGPREESPADEPQPAREARTAPEPDAAEPTDAEAAYEAEAAAEYAAWQAEQNGAER